MKTFICRWKFYDAAEYVEERVQCEHISTAKAYLIRKAQENHMIQIDIEPEEVEP